MLWTATVSMKRGICKKQVQLDALIYFAMIMVNFSLEGRPYEVVIKECVSQLRAEFTFWWPLAFASLVSHFILIFLLEILLYQHCEHFWEVLSTLKALYLSTAVLLDSWFSMSWKWMRQRPWHPKSFWWHLLSKPRIWKLFSLHLKRPSQVTPPPIFNKVT